MALIDKTIFVAFISCISCGTYISMNCSQYVKPMPASMAIKQIKKAVSSVRKQLFQFQFFILIIAL
jgi:transcription elongation factor Elf1